MTISFQTDLRVNGEDVEATIDANVTIDQHGAVWVKSFYVADGDGNELEHDDMAVTEAVCEVARDSWESAREAEYELV